MEAYISRLGEIYTIIREENENLSQLLMMIDMNSENDGYTTLEKNLGAIFMTKTEESN